jgi:hypothetical protein
MMVRLKGVFVAFACPAGISAVLLGKAFLFDGPPVPSPAPKDIDTGE